MLLQKMLILNGNMEFLVLRENLKKTREEFQLLLGVGMIK